MSKFVAALAGVASIFAVSTASATVLTFDDAVVGAASYSSGGVTITENADTINASTGPNGTRGLLANGSTSFWNAVFDSVVSDVSIDLGDFNADVDRIFLAAYDSSDNLIQLVSSDLSSSFIGMIQLTILSDMIKRVEFGVTNEIGLGGIFADNLTFTAGDPVPLPAALPLMATALAAGGAALRRKKKAKA